MINEGKKLVSEIQKKVNSRICELSSDIYELRLQTTRLCEEQKRLREIYDILDKNPELVAVIAEAWRDELIVGGKQ